MTNSDTKFTVSTEGMRELHADRTPWSLTKELVQNSWDEAPDATFCKVTISPDLAPGGTWVTVEDDGPGFRDISDAYTLLAPTPKRLDPTKRGRFNSGEKEVVAVASYAKVTTVGHTVTFPEEGGRVLKTNRRKRGTIVKALIPWDHDQAYQLAVMLRRFRPTDCRLVVNGQEVTQRDAVVSRHTTLPTVLQSAPGEPLRPTRRRTTIDILEPMDDTRWLYELGIPVQPIDCRYDIDVLQKVPMNPNRDAVRNSYLQDLYAEVLNASYELMEGDDFAETWVRTGLEDSRIEEQPVRKTIRERYGERVAMWSSDTDANMRAAEDGVQIVHPRSMSQDERDNLVNLGDLKSTMHHFPPSPISDASPLDTSGDSIKESWSAWVVDLATMAGMVATVKFVNDPTARFRACCTADTRRPEVMFNTHHLTDEWLSQRGADQVELVVHELGHAEAKRAMEHGPAWGYGCATVAGRIAIGMTRDAGFFR